jgi:hypothetical protein
MPIEGYLDHASTTSVEGWLYGYNDPDKPVEVEIVADGAVVATITADQFRQDLLDAGKGNGRHGFSFDMPQGRASNTALRVRPVGKVWYLPHAQNAFPRLYAGFKHSCEYGLPEVPHGFSATPSPDPKREIPLAKRIIAAYHNGCAQMPAAAKRDDGWTHVEGIMFGDCLEILRRKDAEALAVYLREFYAQAISHGTYQGAIATASLQSNGSNAAAGFQDMLASYAESLGVLRVEDPVQHGHYGENLYLPPEEIVAAIDSKLRIATVPPSIAGRKFGIATKNGILNGADLRAAYAAHRIQELIGHLPKPSVCEIGGGIGSAAFFCQRLGIGDVTIIDLPIVAVMQAYFLIQALPETRVVLCGERDDAGPAIRLLPPSFFGRRSFDLVYNQDSFPEMHRDHVVDYLKGVRKIAPALLSINQEAEGPQTADSVQLVVHDVVEAVGGFRRVYRFPHWLRQGYVEELYTVERPPRSSRWRGILVPFVERLVGRP